MTSYTTTGSDMNMHEHTHACKQAGRWRSSQSVRHEDIHRHTHIHIDKSPPCLSFALHSNTQKAVLSTRTILTHTTTLIALDIFSFSRGHIPTLRSSPADANVILGHPGYSTLMFCSLLTFLLLGRRCIWPDQPCAFGEKRF